MATATATPPKTDVSPPGASPPGASPWEMEVSTGGGGDYQLCPAGNHPARVIGLFDIGHQATAFNGEAKDMHQLVLVLELAKKTPAGKPFVLGERYTWSLNPKAKFYGLVSGLTGRSLKEGEKFDPRTLMDLPCMVQVTNEAKGEKTYHSIAAIAQYPDGLPAPTATHKSIVWSVNGKEQFPSEALEWLPYIYGSSILELAEGSREVRRRAATTAHAKDLESDPIPF